MSATFLRFLETGICLPFMLVFGLLKAEGGWQGHACVEVKHNRKLDVSLRK